MWCFSIRMLLNFFQTAGRSTKHYGRLPGSLASRVVQNRVTNGRHNIRLHPTAAVLSLRSRGCAGTLA